MRKFFNLITGNTAYILEYQNVFLFRLQNKEERILEDWRNLRDSLENTVNRLENEGYIEVE